MKHIVAISVSFATAILLSACLSYPDASEPKAVPFDPAMLDADNFENGKYFNPWRRSAVRAFDVWRLFLTRNPYDKSKDPVIPVVANDGSELAGVQNSSKVTWAGHATVIIHDGDDVVLTDPHFSKRVVVYKRKVAPGVPLPSIPPDAMAVVSHNHYDHLDTETVERLPDTIQWFVPSGLAQWFRDRGRERVVELDWWETAQHGRWTITCVPLQHWSYRSGQPTNTTLWCGWILDSSDYRYFFAGDSGYFGGFKELGRRFDPVDVAFLPVGSYEPRWFMREQHMNPEEAYQAFLDLGARYMVPIHWGTFDLGHEPMDKPVMDLRKAVDANNGNPKQVRILAVGQSWHLPENKTIHAATTRQSEQ